MKLTALFREFFASEKAGGLVLVIATIISLVLANSPISDNYNGFWSTGIGEHDLTFWINEALMAFFFLLIGLELEREIYHGELSDLKSAAFPVIAALGGMIVPALIYLSLNAGTPSSNGAGIPMATDIAFALGILSLLGNRVPSSLKVFLAALAVIDDLGAILVIAIFYSKSVVFVNLLAAVGIFVFLIVHNRMRIHNLIPYLAGGVLIWYFMAKSGIHPTLSGVMLAFAIPFRNGGVDSPSYILQHFLHRLVAFFIMPVFAMANTAIDIGNVPLSSIVSSAGIGIIAGLVIGKPAGILLFSYLGARLHIGVLPEQLKWSNILGAGMLAGIGFTMSIFITLLAFDSREMIDSARLAILIASVVSAVAGLLLLKRTLRLIYEDE